MKIDDEGNCEAFGDVDPEQPFHFFVAILLAAFTKTRQTEINAEPNETVNPRRRHESRVEGEKYDKTVPLEESFHVLPR
jgi:hypothetical protein